MVEETGWLIEYGGLCMGVCGGRSLTWVTFTDCHRQVRFCRKQDAENMLRIMECVIGNEYKKAIVTEHMWLDVKKGGS